MAGTSHTEVFNCTPQEVFNIIKDYEKYPEFLAEVKKCKVLKTEGNRKLVEFSVSVVKSFTYTIWLTEKEPTELTWEFASGDIFKSQKGHWKLKEEAGKTRVEYAVEAEFKMFMPGAIAKTLVSVNLPAMMSAYHKRIQTLYGK
ncbi:MAG: type II toxin-antitoxin system RatA family toxin [Pseudobdellovibrionaceae bacterium]